MTSDDFVEIIPYARLGDANRRWQDWLDSRGLRETDFREREFELEVGRGDFGGVIGSFSVYRVRRSALERLLPAEYGHQQGR